MLSIRKGGHRDLERYYTLIEMDFDSEELLGKLNVHKAMLDGAQEMDIVYDDESGMDLAYALVCTKGLYGYVLLKYLAVLPWYRGRGVGIETMRLLHKKYADRQGIIAELTEFEDEDKNRIPKLRRFFARFGYTEIDSDYRISGTAAHVLVKPIKNTADITPVAHRIISDFYSRCLPATTMYRMIDIKPARKKEN